MLCRENKGADQLSGYHEADRVDVKLICVFVFADAKSRFSYNEAHLKVNTEHSSNNIQRIKPTKQIEWVSREA